MCSGSIALGLEVVVNTRNVWKMVGDLPGVCRGQLLFAFGLRCVKSLEPDRRMVRWIHEGDVTLNQLQSGVEPMLAAQPNTTCENAFNRDYHDTLRRIFQGRRINV